ncbi:MAG: GTP-binding protein [Oscillospiraceae bacterium]|nr:GTP-binding protein [Oscillospiraceae bacterium]
MVRIDLITGFLGAGKTTFLLRYARFLLARGLKIGILAYDHGAMNVDMPLLRELRGEHCEIEMLAGACDADCHRRRFRTRLISMCLCGYDRILVEPSGVFDMDEYFDCLSEAPLDRLAEAGNVIAVVDARLEEKLSPEEDFFLASQAACAGKIVLSRVQLADEGEIRKTIRHLRQAQAEIRCESAPVERFLIRDWRELGPEDFEELMNCGCRAADYVKAIAGSPNSFQSLSFLDLPLNGAGITERTRMLFHEPRFGRIIRVKGFFRDQERWFQINATGRDLEIEESRENRAAVIIIGQGLDEAEISLLMTGRLPEHRIL